MKRQKKNIGLFGKRICALLLAVMLLGSSVSVFASSKNSAGTATFSANIDEVLALPTPSASPSPSSSSSPSASPSPSTSTSGTGDVTGGVATSDSTASPSDEEVSASPAEEFNGEYDAQPETEEEVIDAIYSYNVDYNATYDSEGEEEAQKILKPQWEDEVDASLMAEGYLCEEVSDEDGATLYYTFLRDATLSATKEVSTFDELKDAIAGAATGDIISVTDDISFTEVITIPASIIITINSSPTAKTLTAASSRHFKVNGGLTLQTINLNGSAAAGGIDVTGTLTLSTDAIIESCKATNGGAVYLSGGTVTVSGGAIKNNTANLGGGIYATEKGTVKIEGGEMSNCKADTNGGGIYLDSTSTLDISGSSSVVSNTAGKDGGAIYTDKADYKNITTASTVGFSNNSAATSCVPPDSASTNYTNLAYSTSSMDKDGSYLHLLNNFDINYSQSYLVTYYPNDGTGEEYSQRFAIGATHTILANTDTNLGYTREGYSFLGWSTSASDTTAKYTGTGSETVGSDLSDGESIALYAIWIADTYKVVYEPNYSNADSYTVTESVGTAHVILSNSTTNLGFKRTGYTFLGWSTSKSETKATYTGTTNTTNVTSTTETIGSDAKAGDTITLYAVWKSSSSSSTNSSNKSSSSGTTSSSTTSKTGDDSISPVLTFTLAAVSLTGAAALIYVKRRMFKKTAIEGVQTDMDGDTK